MSSTEVRWHPSSTCNENIQFKTQSSNPFNGRIVRQSQVNSIVWSSSQEREDILHPLPRTSPSFLILSADRKINFDDKNCDVKLVTNKLMMMNESIVTLIRNSFGISTYRWLLQVHFEKAYTSIHAYIPWHWRNRAPLCPRWWHWGEG